MIETLKHLSPPRIPSLGLTPLRWPCRAVPGEDAVESYVTYYRQDKRHLFKWKNREMPDCLKFPFLEDIKDRRRDGTTSSRPSRPASGSARDASPEQTWELGLRKRKTACVCVRR